MNCGGSLHLNRFEEFLLVLSERELERFDDIYSDAKWLEGKTAVRGAAAVPGELGAHLVKSTPGPACVEEILDGFKPVRNRRQIMRPRKQDDDELKRLLGSVDEFDDSKDDVDDDADLGQQHCGMSASVVGKNNNNNSNVEAQSELIIATRGAAYQMEFRQHKRDYYTRKLGYEKVDNQVFKEQAECYVRAIQWNLHYYYDGCVSWSWYYPHHFAPWITDIRGFSDMEMKFCLSEPFKPFEQLLAVLPAASKDLLPVVSTFCYALTNYFFLLLTFFNPVHFFLFLSE